MNAPSLAPDGPADRGTASISSRSAIAITQVCWVVVAGICLALFVPSLPLRIAELRGLMTTAPHLGAISLAPGLFVASAFALELLGSVVYFALAGLIVWRRSDSISALLISMFLLAFGAALPGTAYSIMSATPIWRSAPVQLQAIGWTALLLFAFVFPDGAWVPRWSRWLAPFWIVWTVGFFAFAETFFGTHPALIVVAYLIWMAWLGVGVCAQLYRYLWVSTPVQRQQSKWASLGFLCALVGILVASVQQVVALSQSRAVHLDPTAIALSLLIVVCASLPIPISIAIAILRHNLFDIDRLINLTLVYGALTIILAAIYTLAVGLSQVIIQSLTGLHDESPLALVISTLGVAALFQPIRRRIQTAIDRQFYRRRYDAQRIAESFAASLRSELDLAELSERLIQVAHRTMKPKHVSLWLTSPAPDARTRSGDALVHQRDNLATPDAGAEQ